MGCTGSKVCVIILQTFPFEPVNLIVLYKVAVRTCAKFQIASINESEDREVWSSTRPHINLSYLESVPNFRNKH